jgi:hypothetical protein
MRWVVVRPSAENLAKSLAKNHVSQGTPDRNASSNYVVDRFPAA